MIQHILRRVVIALDDSKRVGGFLAQSGGDKFSVFSAVDCRDGVVPPEFDAAAFEHRYGVAARGGEIGCAVSHLRVMQDFAGSPGLDSDLLLVCEDDARWSRQFEACVEAIARRGWEHDYVLLSDVIGVPNGRHLLSFSQKNAQMSLLSVPVGWAGRWPRVVGTYVGVAWGAGAYLVSRRAARRYSALVERLGGIGWKADDYGVWAVPAGVRVELVRPGLCWWEGETTIDSPFIGSMPQGYSEAGWSTLRRARSRLALRTRVTRFGRSLMATGRDIGMLVAGRPRPSSPSNVNGGR